STSVVLAIRVDDDHVLPGPEDHLALLHRKGQGRGDEHRQQVVSAVTPRAVSMGVPVVSRKQALEQVLEIGLGAGPRLHQPEAGRGVGEEQVDDAALGTLAHEPSNLAGHVDDTPTRRIDRELGRSHAYVRAPAPALPTTTSAEATASLPTPSCIPTPAPFGSRSGFDGQRGS